MGTFYLATKADEKKGMKGAYIKKTDDSKKTSQTTKKETKQTKKQTKKEVRQAKRIEPLKVNGIDIVHNQKGLRQAQDEIRKQQLQRLNPEGKNAAVETVKQAKQAMKEVGKATNKARTYATAMATNNDFRKKELAKYALSAGVGLSQLSKGAMKTVENFMDTGTQVTDYTTNWIGHKLGIYDDDEYKKLNENTKKNVEKDVVGDFWKNNLGWDEENARVLNDYSYITEDNLGGQLTYGIGQQIPGLMLGSAGMNYMTKGGQIAANSIYAGLKGKKGLDLVKAATGNLAKAAIVNAPSNIEIGTRSFGGALEEAYKNGATPEQAMRYGIMNAGTEIATEWMTGGIPGLEETTGIFDKGVDTLIDKATGKIKNKYAKAITKSILNYGFEAAGEGFEEAVSEIVSPLLKNASYSKGEKVDWNQVLDAAIMGSIQAGILNAPSSVSNLRGDLRNATQQMQNEQLQQQNIEEQSQQIEQIDQLAQQRVQQIEQAVQQGQMTPQEGTQEIEDIQRYVDAQKNTLQQEQQPQQNQNNQLAQQAVQQIEQRVQSGQISPQDGMQQIEDIQNYLQAQENNQTTPVTNETAQDNINAQEEQKVAQNANNEVENYTPEEQAIIDRMKRTIDIINKNANENHPALTEKQMQEMRDYALSAIENRRNETTKNVNKENIVKQSDAFNLKQEEKTAKPKSETSEETRRKGIQRFGDSGMWSSISKEQFIKNNYLPDTETKYGLTREQVGEMFDNSKTKEYKQLYNKMEELYRNEDVKKTIPLEERQYLVFDAYNKNKSYAEMEQDLINAVNERVNKKQSSLKTETKSKKATVPSSEKVTKTDIQYGDSNDPRIIVGRQASTAYNKTLEQFQRQVEYLTQDAKQAIEDYGGVEKLWKDAQTMSQTEIANNFGKNENVTQDNTNEQKIKQAENKNDLKEVVDEDLYDVDIKEVENQIYREEYKLNEDVDDEDGPVGNYWDIDDTYFKLKNGNTLWLETPTEYGKLKNGKTNYNDEIHNKIEMFIEDANGNIVDEYTLNNEKGEFTREDILNGIKQLTYDDSNKQPEGQIDMFGNVHVSEKSNNNIAETKSSTNNVSELKTKQNEIIQKTNPMNNEYNTGIRSENDIKTWDEVLNLDDETEGQFAWGDYTREDALQAQKDGKVTVYSSYPIENGNFVSTSKIQAEEYAGGPGSKIYSKEVPLNEVAWINGDEGQYAKVDSNQQKQTNIEQQPTQSNVETKEEQTNIPERKTEPVVKVDLTGEKGKQHFMENGYEEKVAQILSEKQKTKTNLKDEAIDVAGQAYRLFVSKGGELERIAKITNRPDLLYKYDKAMRYQAEANQHIGVVQRDLNYKQYKNFIDENGNKTSMSLNGIRKDAKNNNISEQTLNEYLAHNLNVDRYMEDKPVFGKSVTSEDSLKRIAEIEQEHPEIKRIAQNVWTYEHNELKNTYDSGRISKELYDKLSKYEHYVRIQRKVEKPNSSRAILDKNGKISINQGIQEAKGGNQDIFPILETIAQRTIENTKANRDNEVMKEFASATSVGSEDATISAIDNEESFGINPDLVRKNDDGTYSMTFFNNGVATVVPINKAIYDAFTTNKAISDFENAKLTKAATYIPKKMSSMFRSVVTDKNPMFMATNALKDIGDAPFNSKYAKEFAKTYASTEALRQVAGNGVYNQLYNAAGGQSDSYFTEGEFKDKTQSKIGKATEKLLTPIEKGNEIVETVPRMAEFIATIKANGYEANKNGDLVLKDSKKAKGRTAESVLDEALYNAAEVTTNFKRGGDLAKAINRNGGTFFNASIQGFDKQIRNFKDAFTSGDKKKIVGLLLKALIFGIAPTMLNDAANDDDDEYKNMQDYLKDNYYLFKGKDGNYIRIPKGRAMSVIGSAYRRTKDYASGNKDAFKGFTKFASGQVAPNNPFESNIIAPFFAVKNNKSWSGSKIVSQSMEKRPAEEQYNEKTDEFSKWLGGKLKVSPMKINYLIDQYSGGIGDVALPMMTPKATSKSSNPLVQPFVSKFTADSVYQQKSVGNFYDAMDAAETKKYSVKATKEDKVKYTYLYSQNQKMAELRKKQSKVQANNSLSQSEKYDQAREIQKEINKLADESVKNSNNIKDHKYYATIGENTYYLTTDNDGNDVWAKDGYADSHKKAADKKGVALYDYYKEKYEERKAKKK